MRSECRSPSPLCQALRRLTVIPPPASWLRTVWLSTKLRIVDGSDTSGGSRTQQILADSARQLLALGRLDLAELLALKALAKNEGSADCHSVMANVLDEKGDWHDLSVHLRRARELAPQAPQVRLNLRWRCCARAISPRVCHSTKRGWKSRPGRALPRGKAAPQCGCAC